MHGTQFPTYKVFVVHTSSELLEKHRPFCTQFYQKSQQWQHPRHKTNENKQGEENIESPLYRFV
jgi:hypothetical protein